MALIGYVIELPIVGLAAVVFAASVYLHFVGATIDWGPLTYFPWWMVVATFVILVVAILVHLFSDNFSVLLSTFVVLILALAFGAIYQNTDFGTSPSVHQTAKVDNTVYANNSGVCVRGDKPVKGYVIARITTGVKKGWAKTGKNGMVLCTLAAKSATTPSTTVPASSCASGQNVVYDANQGNRVLSQGLSPDPRLR